MHTALFAAFATLVVTAGIHTAIAADGRTPSVDQALSRIRKSRPRLILTDERLAELKELAKADELLAGCVRAVLVEADRTIKKPPLEHRLVGPRLLSVSRGCLRRVYLLALAYRWTGREAYAEAAKENLLTVCSFPDWNPSHFLDTAEMSHAVGIGYDWLFDYLDADSRTGIREGLIRLGLQPGLKAYRDGAWWVRSEYNWNQVCNCGLSIGVLAVADSEPDLARRVLSAAVPSLPKALASYAPDGAWGEGPGYWNYATSYTAFGLAAMETALGTDFGLSKAEGLSEAGCFPLHTTGPTGLYFNFADVGERSRRRNLPCLFYLARKFGKPQLAAAEREMMSRHPGDTMDVIWYVPPAKTKPKPLAPDKLFRGPVEVAVFRGAWDDPDALFVAVKAGFNRVNHGHLDLGNFEMDALGVRWARDLGSDDYNLPGYWEGRAGGRRWSYYRLNSFSHSVPLLAGAGQDINAEAKVVKFESLAESGFAVIDLTGAYAEHSRKVMRGVQVLAGRRAVLVQDEFDLPKPCEVAWAMTTDAKTSLDGATATLRQDGKQLTATILSPADAEFSVESAEQKPPQKANKGVRRLMIRISAGKGPLRVAVLLSPAWPDGKKQDVPKLKPLSAWK